MRVKDIQIGETYNGVKVLEDLGYHKGGRRYLCKCPRCGRSFELQQYKVGITQTCRECYIERGCDGMIGRKYGRLSVLSFSHTENGHAYVNCKCECGNDCTIMANRLKLKETQSCGCFSKDIHRIAARLRCIAVSDTFDYKDGITKHPLYTTWSSMLQRCYDTNIPSYRNYGGRGIKVCDRWLPENKGFENFVADMGKRPSKGHSIDRIDVNGDYCPENCRWATWVEQANNKTNNSYVYVGDERYTISIFHRMRGIKRSLSSFSSWLKRGLDVNFLLATDGDSYKDETMREQLNEHINFNRIVYENQS